MPQNAFVKVAEWGNLVAVTYGNGCTVQERSRICALPELNSLDDYCFPTWYGRAIWYEQEISFAVLTI